MSASPFPRFKGLTFSEVLPKADLLGVASVEVSSSQRVSFEVPKNFDYRLQTGERGAISIRLRELNEQILAYRVDDMPSDEATRRQVFELAKAVSAPLIITGPEPAAIEALDKLADEFGINVAVESKKDPKGVMSALQGRGKRIGVAADLGGWMQEGVKPVDGLAAVKDKLMMVTVSDRSAFGAKGHDVTLGAGVADLDDFFLAAFRAGLKPLFITVKATGAPDNYADMLKNLTGFEKVMLPAMAARVRQVVDSPEGKIRGGDRLPPT